MNIEDKSFWKNIESHILKALSTLFIGGIVAFVSFYYNTNSALGQQSNDLKKVEKKIDDINVIPKINRMNINQVQLKIKSLEDKVETMRKESRDDNIRTNQKLDKILDKIK